MASSPTKLEAMDIELRVIKRKKKDKAHRNRGQGEVKIISVVINVEVQFAVISLSLSLFLQSNGCASSSFEVVVRNGMDTVEQ